MTTKSRLALLSSLAATPAFAAPFLAIGDNAELFLTARTEVRYEDNLTYAAGNKVDDAIFEFAPGLELTFGKSSLTKGSLVVFERFVSYADNKESNEELANLIGSATYEGSKLTFSVDGSFREHAQNGRDLLAAVPGVLVARYDVTAFGGTAEAAVTEKSKVGVGAAYSGTQYINNALLVDSSTITVPVNYYFAVRPKLDLSSGVQFRTTNVDGPGNDSDDVYFNVGSRGEFTPKLLGSFSVGYNMRNSEAANGDDESIGLKAGLTYLYSVKTQFTLDLSNDFGTSAGGFGQETAKISLGVRSEIAADLSAFASLGYENIDYSVGGREDDYYSARIGASYTLNQYLSFDLSYSRYENCSSGGPDFVANVISLSASARY